MSKHSCCWILATGEYCSQPVGYTIPKDEEDNRYRKYNIYCDNHKRIHAERIAAGDLDELEIEEFDTN